MIFPGKININVNAQKLCVGGKRNYITVNYYRIFIKINTFLSLWNSKATVLFAFMCNLLVLSHSIILGISILIVFTMVFASELSKRMLVSSEGRRNLSLVLTLGRSLMHNWKRIGPKIDPCGTPHSILKKDYEVLFNDTN